MATPAHSQSASARMSYEEFLAWCDEDTWAEWVDGEVVLMSPASDPHQDLEDFLIAILRIFVETHGLGWVRSAPFQMRLSNLARGREPDILFVRKDRVSLVQKTYLDGPADLVVEITSPESLLRDRGEKFAEYELAGVHEYWLLDPEHKRADFYVRESDGRYRLVTVGDDGVYRSQAIQGFWLKVAWLWQDPLPRVLAVLKELGVTG